MRISDKIKEIRQQKDMTVKEFSEALEVDENTVCRWERGSHRPNIRKIRDIANFANIPVYEFYDDMETKKSALGRKIKNIRLEKGMTLEEFGKMFGTSKSIVYRWEIGTNAPNRKRLKEIADIADMSVVELLEQIESTGTERELLGQKIKQIRKQCGLTMIEFGKALNVTNVTVCRWENGQRLPNVFTILKIAKMGNMTVEEFLS